MRALMSVADKTGIETLARGLRALGIEIISTGKTAAALTSAGIESRSVADITGFPEILDGRVKTLHPAVHGGILAKRDDESAAGRAGPAPDCADRYRRLQSLSVCQGGRLTRTRLSKQ